MHPPVGKLSKLSLGASGSGMAPVTRSRSFSAGDTRAQTPDAAHQHRQSGHHGSSSLVPQGGAGNTSNEPNEGEDVDEDEENDEDDEDGEDDEDDEDEDDDDEGPVRSPLTSLFYDIDGLDDETQELVRELFRPPAAEETPPIVIEWCGISNDPDVYAFQLQEIIPRTIRVGSATSRIPQPSCNCTGSEDKPCRHLVWLMDQIAKQTMAHDEDHESAREASGTRGANQNAEAEKAKEGDQDRPLVLDPKTAFPRALGSAYSRISDFHIGILANALHCRAGPPNGRPDSHRVREAREILAGLHGVQDDAGVDTYAPEIFDLERRALERLLWGTETKQQHHTKLDTEEARDAEDKAVDAEMGPYGGRAVQDMDLETAYEESERSHDEEDSAQQPVDARHSPKRPRHDRQSRPGAAIESQPPGGRRSGGRDQASHPRQYRQIRDLVERGDLQRTVLRLLVANDEFFSLFLKLLTPQDKARDPFRKIQQRVESVLDALRAARTTGKPGQSAAGETISVAWAAKHVHSAAHQIRHLLERGMDGRKPGQSPAAPASWVKAGAARAVLWIMTALVSKHTRDAHDGATQDDRNLYQRLIGNNGLGDTGRAGNDVLLDVLDAVHDQVQFLSQVERVRRRIQRNGYRAPYMQRLDAILAKMRAIRDEKDAVGGTGAGGPASYDYLPSQVAGTKRPDPPSGGSAAERKPKRSR